MTPPSDELRELWNSEPGGTRCDPAEVLRQLERAGSGFDRTIRLRDLRESAAGILVAVIFLWLAVHDRTPLESAAHLWLAACGVWIILYLRRYSKISRRPETAQTLLAYQQDLLDRFDRQIRLLRSAKYWYILPFWTGLVFSAAAVLARNGNLKLFCLMVAFATLINAVLWWLNEFAGVRCLKNKRRNLAALTGSEEVSK